MEREIGFKGGKKIMEKIQTAQEIIDTCETKLTPGEIKVIEEKVRKEDK